MFIPKLLMPRSCLPLAFLDVNGISGDIPGKRLFSAKIPLLQTKLSSGNNPAGPDVLIAESGVTPCLYAAELVRPGIYALCQLCAWVTLKDLEKLCSKFKAQPNSKSVERSVLPGDKWWQEARIRGDGAASNPEPRQCKAWVAGGFQLCLKTPASTMPSAAIPTEENLRQTQQKQAFTDSENAIQNLPVQEDTQNADDIFNMIRTQYQEALYMSQVSPIKLLYYACDADRIRPH